MTARERPIIFGAPMVRAILEGRKSQTRRVVKPQPIMRDGEPIWPADSKRPRGRGFEDCPYGAPGDRLWVREAWRALRRFDSISPRGIEAGSMVAYDADTPTGDYRQAPVGRMGKLRTGRFMSRWASRITLEVTGVRVERLQSISEADAVAEGIRMQPFHPDDGWPLSQGFTWREEDGRCTLFPSACDAYRDLWESLHGPGSWDANPFVWVVEFRRIEA